MSSVESDFTDYDVDDELEAALHELKIQVKKSS